MCLTATCRRHHSLTPVGNWLKRRHRQLFVGLLKIVDAQYGGGSPRSAIAKHRPLILEDAPEGGSD
jgi:hypothetical protein